MLTTRTKNGIIILVFFVFLTICLYMYFSDEAGNSNTGSSVAEANNQFAYDAYIQLGRNNTSSNLFFSPYSISSAFALTYEGARGKTADEIRTVFHFPRNISMLRQGFSAIDGGLNDAKDANYTLRTANALWTEKSCEFLPAYTDNALRYYGAKTTNLDFIGQPEASRQTINRWVEEKTVGKIRDLIPENSIDKLTRLVITNAIYFKGNWVLPFDNHTTTRMDFHVTPDETVQVPTMQGEARFNYAETDDLQVLELPYAHGPGHELSMLIFLPKNATFAAADAALNPRNLTEIQSSATSQQIMVYLPKFKIESTYKLPHALSSMGMPTAFTGYADFSGMDGTKDLFIDTVIHKAYIDVNEEGTEAAAATAVGVFGDSGQNKTIPIFRADHPFLFLIQDKEARTILFVGRVANPAAETE